MPNDIKLSTVLIVDDSEIDTLIHRKVLEQVKHVKEIHTASSGEAAMNLLTEYFDHVRPLPDIILLDLNMPVMNGFEFIRNFRDASLSGKEKVMIIIVTSSTSASDLKKAKEINIDHFVEKPLTEAKILKVIG